MAWKDLSYWLRGGIIFISVSFIFFLIFWILGIARIMSEYTWPSEKGLEVILYSLPFSAQLLLIVELFVNQMEIPQIFLPKLFASFFPENNNTSIFIIPSVIVLIVDFVIGAIIGWIYGKIKSRSKK